MQPATTPDWVTRLGAEPCDPTRAEWSQWAADVTTYCVTFEAVSHKRNRHEWVDGWHDDYGKVVLRPHDDSGRTVAEFEVIKALRAAGWAARWQDTFGAKPDWMRPWTEVKAPRPVAECLLNTIAVSERAKPWDVLAWRGEEVLFIECKAAKEKLTRPERAFIWGAQKIGIPLDRFSIVCGSVTYPPRSPA